MIGEQLECNNFKHSLENLIKNSKSWGGKITIGCHGYKHRCWSAFRPDKEGFRNDLQNELCQYSFLQVNRVFDQDPQKINLT